MSTFGLVHTAISVLPIPLGAYAFFRDGKIDPRNRVGKAYLATMLVGTVTGFAFAFTKGFNPPAQILSMATLVVLLAGMFAEKLQWLGHARAYVETASLSISYFLLMFFTTTETLTRLPVGHPFAANAESPELLPVRLVLLAGLVVGLGYQVHKLRTADHPTPVSLS